MDTNPCDDQLRLRNHELQFVRNGEVVWHFAIADLLLVAEYTNDQGPWRDDYYFVFGVGRPAVYYEVELGSGLNALAELSTELGVRLEPGLANSTDWQSRVLWPPALVGRALFDRHEQSRPAGAWNRLKDRVIPRHDAIFDEMVAEYLRRQSG